MSKMDINNFQTERRHTTVNKFYYNASKAERQKEHTCYTMQLL